LCRLVLPAAARGKNLFFGMSIDPGRRPAAKPLLFIFSYVKRL